MDRRKNLLIGIMVGIAIVAVSVYATGFSKRLLTPFFGSSTAFKVSESAAAPDLASGNWINSEPLKLQDLRGRVMGRGDPDLADERKSHRDHRTGHAQRCDRLRRIAKEGLAGEIEAWCHVITEAVDGISPRWCTTPPAQGVRNLRFGIRV